MTGLTHSALSDHKMDAHISPSDILKHVCSRWGARILMILSQHPSLRFSELRAELGNVSEKMLAQTLQTLTQDGFILREAYTTMPPTVVYRLTPLGQQLATHVSPLVHWIDLNLEHIKQARYHAIGMAAHHGEEKQETSAHL